MNIREVDEPNRVLASPNTALVIVRGFLRPGIQAGDPFDVEVRCPSQSDTSSIRNGWLVETRLTELAVLGEQIRKGSSDGPLPGSRAGRSLGRRRERPGPGLAGSNPRRRRGPQVPQPGPHPVERPSVGSAQRRESARPFNKRFHTYIAGRKEGVATPKTDEYIEIVLHPRYKDNVGRYMQGGSQYRRQRERFQPATAAPAAGSSS